ncbi:nipped-B cohesin loading factor isoform X2 [Arctopsyche grandis]|uniref:nipped-B cohesin loading factor isoform X2 n=1 Tax=Arctopsyche grandis TaxID=121162 RepID=UPI00406D8A71
MRRPNIAMADRDIPMVPITTLAGVASLTDLLPVLPLPTPLPQTLSNKSQLFHPRVAEEAAILLANPDEALANILSQSLIHTSVDHIELKDNYAGTEPSMLQRQNMPELLKAILDINPNVFTDQPAKKWNNHNYTSKLNGIPSPGSYIPYSYSPQNSIQNSLPAAGFVPCQPSYKSVKPSNVLPPQPSPHVTMASPPSQSTFLQPATSTPQNHMPTSMDWNSTETMLNSPSIPQHSQMVGRASVITEQKPMQHPQNGGYFTGMPSSESFDQISTQSMNLSDMATEKDPLAISPPHQPVHEPQSSVNLMEEISFQQRGNVVISGQSPAQASVAPSPLRHEPQVSIPLQQDIYSMNAVQSTTDVKQDAPEPAKHNLLAEARLPIVKLNRLNLDDALLKKSTPSENRRSTPQTDPDSDDAPLKPKSSDKVKSEIDEARERNWLAVKRKHEEANKLEEQSAAIVKPKLRKVERRLVPVVEMLSVDELMETNTYQRFNRLIDAVFDVVDDENFVNDADICDVPEEWLLPRFQLQELCAEAAKLKTLGAMEAIPADRLVRLLNILEKNIRAGERISPLGDPDDSEDVRLMWMETTLERVMSAADACLTALYIMTAPNMPKRVVLEDVIDRIILFTKYQLHNTIYCSYDPVYRIQSTSKKKGDQRKKRSHGSSGGYGREKGIHELYSRQHETVSLLAELLAGASLTDTTVLHASSAGVSPFFVENVSELQLSALKLVTTIFTKYEQHRRLLLDDILASIARIPSTKRNLRSYRLNSEQHIQMLTALVLQLIQCVVVLPDTLDKSDKDKPEKGDEQSTSKMSQVDKDIFIYSKYDAAVSIGGTFLTSFLNKCRSRSEEIDFRPLFENFVHDLLSTVNKPEWPATELLLSLLGTMLVKYTSDKSMEMSVRVASLEYLGLVAARLRKDTVQSRGKLSTMDHIIRDIKAEEEKDGVYMDGMLDGLDVDEERIQFLQRVLLDYLAVNGQRDQAWGYARHFYLTQWYRDTAHQKKSLTQPKKQTPHKRKKKHKDASSDEDSDQEEEIERMFKNSDGHSNSKNTESAVENAAAYRMIERRKEFYVSKIRPFRYQGGSQVQVMQSYIDYSGAELISQYLASKRSFSQSFDRYLQKILLILCENSIAIRTKAMKCLAMIVEVDPGVLARNDMQAGVHRSFLDQSTSVREAAVDLVGKFVLSRPELIDKYYCMLSCRILDTGVSVRKRVIKILKDICIECPEFPKIPEICVKMIRRVNDEEGIRKLVMEVFQNMWFSPCPVTSHQRNIDPTSDPLTRKVLNITDVVLSSRDIGLEWFQQLLQSLFKPKEDKDDSTKIVFTPPKSLLLACQQIVDCLIENLLRLEETSLPDGGQGNSERLVACISTLHLFAKIRPQLLVNHALTLQPYLSLKCQTSNDQKVISFVASTLELVVPLMEHPSETFLAQLEEDSVKLILQHGQIVIASCLSCLGSIVNNVTKNYKLIRDVFHKYHGVLVNWKHGWQTNPEMMRTTHRRPQFRRALFIIGLLLRHFDFTDTNVIQGLALDIKDQVFRTLMFFLHLDDEDFQAHTLKSVGSVCVRHYEFMLQPELKEYYHYLLTSHLTLLDMKAEVLKNIEMYLLEEEQRMIRQDKEWSKRSKQENLKEMGDVSSGMASTVIQLYIKEILDSFLHPSTIVRTSAMKVTQLVLAQGLIHPVQIVPYLICMSTDIEVTVSHTADKQLQEIDKKYPGFIHMKSQSGIKLSYNLQKILQICPKNFGIIRGFRIKEPDEYPTALNGFLYSLLRSTKPQRRALALSMLKHFDEHAKTPLAQMLYLADNLAYFPYQVQDEPLFIIHHIDIIISTSGSSLLQLFRDGLISLKPPPDPAAAYINSVTGMPITDVPIDDEEEDEEDATALMARLPSETTKLQECLGTAQGCFLLLVLKQHLKATFGMTDAKISQYSPSEGAKVYEKAVNRRNNAKFNPKATVSKLKEGGCIKELDEDGRKDLINQYLEFKQLMLKFDPEEEDEDEVPAIVAAPAAAAQQPTPATTSAT